MQFHVQKERSERQEAQQRSETARLVLEDTTVEWEQSCQSSVLVDKNALLAQLQHHLVLQENTALLKLPLGSLAPLLTTVHKALRNTSNA